MIGILLMSHGDLANGIVSTANCILEAQDNVEVLTLGIEDDIDTFASQMIEKIDQLDSGDGVLVMVDLMGGSPCNKSSMQLREKKIELITGVNFPMYVAACEARDEGLNLDEIKESCVQAGKDGIVSMRDYFRAKGMNI